MFHWSIVYWEFGLVWLWLFFNLFHLNFVPNIFGRFVPKITFTTENSLFSHCVSDTIWSALFFNLCRTLRDQFDNRALRPHNCIYTFAIESIYFGNTLAVIANIVCVRLLVWINVNIISGRFWLWRNVYLFTRCY